MEDFDEYPTEPEQGQKLRIIHVLHSMAYGGIETLLINWLKTAQRVGKLDIMLVCFRHPGGDEQPFVEKAREAGLEPRYLTWHKLKPVWKATHQLTQLIREHQAQIVHAHNTYAELVSYLACRNSPVKVMSTLYVWDDKSVGFTRLMLLKISAYVLRRFDLLTAQCQKTIDDSAEWGLDPRKIIPVPTGFQIPQHDTVDSGERNRLRAARGAAPDDIVLCNIARLYPEKGHERLLRLWPSIHEKFPKAKLWIYGVGPLEEQLLELHKELDLGESVKFLGFAGNLMAELELCDIQVHPSFCEGIPLAICAGMASGLPIVSTGVGGIPEVITDGQSGLLTDVQDMDGFLKCTLDLIRDEELRHRLGREAKRFIEEEYSLEAAVATLEEIYRNLLRQSKSQREPAEIV